jgi:hypothetical protein
MNGIKTFIKTVSPSPIRKVASDFYWWFYNRGRHQFAAAFSPLYRKSMMRLKEYSNIQRGDRCFIIGNGPSLNRTDLSRLKDEYTFGLNRIYLLFSELGFTTTYLTLVNTLVVEQCADELMKLPIPKFITWRGRQWMADDPRAIFIDTDYTLPETFTEDATKRIYEGYTVTYVAMQLAFYMGFEQVILIGVDHNFKTKGPPNTVVISDGQDVNHFHPEYFGKGFQWQLPDLEGSERAYKLAKQAYERHGRQILDATVGGKLNIYPKVEYESLFDT